MRSKGSSPPSSCQRRLASRAEGARPPKTVGSEFSETASIMLPLGSILRFGLTATARVHNGATEGSRAAAATSPHRSTDGPPGGNVA